MNDDKLFWQARCGDDDLRIVEQLLSAYITVSDGADLCLVDLYSRIRCDKFSSLSQIMAHEKNEKYFQTLQSALDEEKIDCDIVAKASRVLETFTPTYTRDQ